jgi:hypothetical protein
MLKVRDCIMRGVTIGQSAKMSLMCGGITCQRRVTCEVDPDDQLALLNKTQTLMFSLLAMAEAPDTGSDLYDDAGYDQCMETGEEGKEGEEGGDAEPDADDDGEEEEDEADATGSSQGAEHRPKRRRTEQRDDQQLLAAYSSRCLADRMNGEEQEASSSWSTLLRNDSAVSRAALKEAKYVKEFDAMHEMHALSSIFFRCSASAMISSMLSTAAPHRRRESSNSFLTLDTVGMLNEANELHEEKLTALADAAESEAGQSVLRDLILSFKLPAKALGVRRTVGLSRETNASATKNYSEILNVAHEAAMRGAIWSYESDPDVVHKMCALLAGLALVMCRSKDEIRKGNAFNGRVVLPFLDAPPPQHSVSRMALIPETSDWVVYTTDTGGKPRVRCRKSGYEGFCECVLLLSKSL